VLQALEYLWNYAPPASAATLLAPVVRHLPAHRPALVCILSDFRMPDWQEVLDMLNTTHDTLAVLIEDEAEITLEALGRIAVRDLDSGQVVELDTASTAYRRAYREQMLAERTVREQMLQHSCGTQYVVANHTTDYRRELLRLFLARMARAWI
jgi:hypothetical protein